jgi:hypothetical protein
MRFSDAKAIALFVLTLSGCAVSGLPFEKIRPPEGKSVIYVYRPDDGFFSLSGDKFPIVWCDAGG